MAKFKVGEICESYSGIRGVWEECVIISEPKDHDWEGDGGLWVYAGFYEIVDHEDRWQIPEERLRKLRPGSDPSSWEAMEDLWVPDEIKQPLQA